ncbi:inactive peptidyl-prolyl cis-trans isomerase FKBP6 [Salarias fasciatus]|uniref:inactive peptidyl-prolyl cis-trans isomerase FKBP6 n=1 Tax=Salarias fasciatus TaxID=181472 RepID=UPI00117659D9|nr:inactive peptidyl-prolyl cis-trans isomerase FKBP6 [Salarias fasciatus]
MPENGITSNVRVIIHAEIAGTQRPFDQLRRGMRDILGDGGILKEVVQPGEGPHVPRNASLIMHYSGYLEYCSQPFETTKNFKYPPMLKLGREVTLPGMELGVLTMQKGEFSRFLFQPSYAYGAIGCPPMIPASAVVLFEIHVIDFLDSGQVDDFYEMSPVEQNAASFSMLLEVVGTLRGFGNLCFAKSRYDNAKGLYKQALVLLGNRETQDEAEKERIRTALLLLYLNLSLTELRLDSPHKALKYSNKALEIDSANTKALYRSGQAYLELGEYESAYRNLVAAQAKKPFDCDINKLLKAAATRYKDSLDKEKDMCLKMFKHL